MILKCHARTQVDSILTCEASSQTSNVNERPHNRTDSGAAENGKEEMKRKVATLKKLLEEKDRPIWKQNEIHERQRKHPIHQNEGVNAEEFPAAQNQVHEEIVSLKERRPPKKKRAEQSSEQESGTWLEPHCPWRPCGQDRKSTLSQPRHEPSH